MDFKRDTNTSTQHCAEGPGKLSKKNGGGVHSDWKGRNETLSICDDMIFDVENPKESTKKQLELINEIKKVARYKLNIK